MTLWRRVVGFVSRVRDFCARRRLAREAKQEIELHLDLLAAQYVRAGEPPAEARRLARAKFGGIVQIRELLRSRWSGQHGGAHWSALSRAFPDVLRTRGGG
jgi:hypothetical protein